MYLSGRTTAELDARETRDETPPELVLSQLVSHMQPIVSVRQREVRLVEALLRRCDRRGRVRLPGELFADAAKRGYREELETAARKAALDAYQCVLVNAGPRPPVLSLNTDASLVLRGARGADELAAEVHERGLIPSSVALEILESALPHGAQLEEFCRTARRMGFLLALDDVGMGHSNLGRIPRLEPDILKIDRELVHGMSLSYHRREVFRSLLSLAHQIGALVIAEGIEDESDVHVGLTLGCDLFQGFYFGRPHDVRAGDPLCDESRLRAAGDELRASATRRLNDRRARQRRSEQAARHLVSQLRSVGQTSFDGLLRQALARMPFAEALYILDDHGIQITDTAHRVASSRQALFQPAERGADQSLKPYFLMLCSGLDRYTSEPYVSSASGNFCITMSRMFTNVLGQSYVLCCDLNVPKEP